MIKSFKHKGLRLFFEQGSSRGIQPEHANKIRMRLTAIDTAAEISDIDLPGFRLHRLKGDKANLWSVRISGNWRITFEFADGNAHLLDYEDYH